MNRDKLDRVLLEATIAATVATEIVIGVIFIIFSPVIGIISIVLFLLPRNWKTKLLGEDKYDPLIDD
jgi:hypothetical protein